MELTLYDWAPSPFCIKTRAVLDFKGVPYRTVSALASVRSLRRRGHVGKAPALEIDGRLVVDSTDIAHELERLFPQPGIIPTDPRQRALCHALEDWADEALYFIGLWFQWVEPSGAAMVPRAFGTSLAGRLAYRAYRHLIHRQLRGQGTGRKTAAHIASDLQRELQAIDALIGTDGFLLGETPMLCDFALFGQLRYLSRPPQSAAALSAHPRIGAYLQRMKAQCAPSGSWPVPRAPALAPSYSGA
jgi:glutathione S-transferase